MVKKFLMTSHSSFATSALERFSWFGTCVEGSIFEWYSPNSNNSAEMMIKIIIHASL